MVTGSCLCRAITFTLSEPLAPIQVCHCIECRKAQGGPFATNIPVPVADFQLLGGAEFLQAFSSSPGKYRVFCRCCGSPIFSRRDSLPTLVRVRVGTLDGQLETQPVTHAFIGEKANWWPINDDLPQFLRGVTVK